MVTYIIESAEFILYKDKNMKKIFCPGIEAKGSIVALPFCTY